MELFVSRETTADRSGNCVWFRSAEGIRVRRCVALALAIGFPSIPTCSAATLQLSFRHRVAGEEMQPASMRYQSAAGETYSITRVSWLIGGVTLVRADGTTIERADHVEWIDAEQNRNSVRLENVAPGEYTAVRFTIGLDPKLNHADTAQWPANHPLNPNLNGLHWSWQGGYVFLAAEGMWRAPGVFQDGWSFHLARDTNRTVVSLPVALALTNDLRLSVDFNLAALLDGPMPLSFGKDGSSTHSRDGDPIAKSLRRNLATAFRASAIESLIDDQQSRRITPLYLPATFTPYAFKMSSTFPMPALPADNPLITERVELGEKLFREPLLSRDGSLSCASCHSEKNAFADARRVSVGVEGRTGARNSMPLFNLAWKSTFFWDGRAPSLRAQALMPIQDHSEMDESLSNIVAKLSAKTNSTPYADLFTKAFGTPEVTSEKIGLALEQFLLTLTSFDSTFDRATRGEQELTPVEQRGLELFMTEYDPRRGLYGADCFHCHGGPLFQSQTFANNGLDSRFTDRGRGKVTGQRGDDGKFATPSLRNIELTGPYMHDGRFATLEEVVEHYSSGVQRSDTLDPNLAKHPTGGLQLSSSDKQALVAFLRTLTDEKFKRDSSPRLAQGRIAP